MSLSITVLGSGSSGNATLVSNGQAHVLVDVGLSAKQTKLRLAECGVSPEEISAIVLSHEHTDHTRGVTTFCKNLPIPVFVTNDTLAASNLDIPAHRRQKIEAGVPFDIHGVVFTPFAVSHDAVDPVAFTIEKDHVKAAVVTDLGYMSNLVLERLKGCDAIVLESNHDVKMLQVGPYPWHLKQRVAGRRGHLSNENVAQFLAEGFDGRARHLILAHLSKQNNLPVLALESARSAVSGTSSLRAVQTRVELTSPDKVGPCVRL